MRTVTLPSTAIQLTRISGSKSARSPAWKREAASKAFHCMSARESLWRNYAYVNKQGNLLSTTTWEGVQEGINDSRYVAMLRHLIETARKSDKQENQSLADSAQMTLDRILADIVPKNDTESQRRLDELRALVARQIMRFVHIGVSTG